MSTSAQTYRCAACNRQVPAHIQRCRCGSLRASGPDATLAFDKVGALAPARSWRRFVGTAVLVAVGFAAGMLAENRRTRGNQLEMSLKTLRTGVARGYEQGHRDGWEEAQRRANAIIDVLVMSKAAPTRLVLERSPDEEALVRLQRQRLEREECEREWARAGLRSTALLCR
jgi:hypothetical protein